MVLKNTDVERRGRSRQLVVGVHAWLSSSVALSQVREVVAREMPDADLLFVDYPAHLASTADPVDIAMALVTAISKAASDREREGTPYGSIVMIGHSLGALLVRKAYVYARGQTQDVRGPLRARSRDWHRLVSRIILMAGTNRGWTLDKKARHLAWHRWLAFWLASLLWHWFRVGRLINSVRGGAPFVANLRVQWLNLTKDSTQAVPATIQLLGTIDDIVSEEDNVDVQSGANFIYREVPETGHANVIDFTGRAGKERKRQFLYALSTPVEDLRSDYLKPLETAPEVDRLVFVMHGIRDYGFWTRKVADRVEEIAPRLGQKAVALTSGYGFFSMVGFLLQPERQRNVRWLMDRYTEARALYPNARVSFIGHSNGSYLLASALERYAACSFDHVVFAGSVVCRTFPWDSMVREGRIRAIRNFVATADWVVAIFPAVFEQLRLSDLGSSGHNGFVEHEGQRYQVAFVKGMHSAALDGENFDALARFALGDVSSQPPQDLIAGEESLIVSTLSKLCLVVWLLLLAIAIGPVAALWLFGGPWPLPWTPWWSTALLWVGLIYLVLRRY